MLLHGKARKVMIDTHVYPDYQAMIEAIDKGGITDDLLRRIVQKHAYSAQNSKSLMARYAACMGGVPIFSRRPRFDGGEEVINNRINNDFFSEIIDFKTGYFAGNPISYSYANTAEALGNTGDADEDAQAARDAASKALTDFVARTNMYDIDMECTKLASICGYAGRLFYIDAEGDERVMVVPPDECIILSRTRDITQPTYGVRYYERVCIDDTASIYAEFYDAANVYYAEGNSVDQLTIKRIAPHLFDMCPLQGIPNNREMQGDAEKVIALIDAYDRALSDANNELESFAHAYMVWKNIDIDDEEKRKAQASGSLQFFTPGTDGDVYFLTKNINDTFIEHHIDRLEQNIYRFSKTPNLSDDAFGTASGVALKFKLTGLEAKCGMFEAKMLSAGTYMFRLLAGVWAKRRIKADPLQCTMAFKRNFPADVQQEAQMVQALIAAGLPKEVAFEQLSFVDDIDWVMQMIEREKDVMSELMDDDTPDAVEDGEEALENSSATIDKA